MGNVTNGKAVIQTSTVDISELRAKTTTKLEKLIKAAVKHGRLWGEFDEILVVQIPGARRKTWYGSRVGPATYVTLRCWELTTVGDYTYYLADTGKIVVVRTWEHPASIIEAPWFDTKWSSVTYFLNPDGFANVDLGTMIMLAETPELQNLY